MVPHRTQWPAGAGNGRRRPDRLARAVQHLGKTERELCVPQWPVPQNLRFQGQYLDRESGLHYNLFRYYDPVAGRYTQMDPIGVAGGLNIYSYWGDLLVWVEPVGLSCSKPKT